MMNKQRKCWYTESMIVDEMQLGIQGAGIKVYEETFLNPSNTFKVSSLLRFAPVV